MTMTRLMIGLASALFIGGLILVGQPASANQSREEITLSPASVKLDGAPGENQTGSFKVINSGEGQLRFTVYARPYSVQTEDYTPDYTQVAERSSVYRWVQFDLTEGSLQPGDEANINYTIRIPETASPGGHYSVLFAETVPEADEEQMVVRNKRVGTIVRLTVDGEHEERGRTESIKLGRFWLDAPLLGEIRIENTGNVDLDAQTSLTVWSLFGRELHREVRTSAVFPDQPRRIAMEWTDGGAFGVYKVALVSEVLDESTSLERYVVRVPTWGLVLLAVVIILAGGLYAGYRQKR